MRFGGLRCTPKRNEADEIHGFKEGRQRGSTPPRINLRVELWVMEPGGIFLNQCMKIRKRTGAKLFKQNNGNENYDKITSSCSLLRTLRCREPDYVLYIYYLI